MGRDWDATITRIIDNPISIRQAFWAPYKKLVRMIEEQIAKRAAAAEASSSSQLEAAAKATAEANKAKPVEPKTIDVGTVAALAVAFGAIVIAVAIVLVVAYLVLDKLGFINEWTNGRMGTDKPPQLEKAVPGPTAPPEAPAKPAEPAK